MADDLQAAARILRRKDKTIKEMAHENAVLEAHIRILESRKAAAARVEFDLSADELPALLRPQIGPLHD